MLFCNEKSAEKRNVSADFYLEAEAGLRSAVSQHPYEKERSESFCFDNLMPVRWVRSIPQRELRGLLPRPFSCSARSAR